jgi:hypothetical protein
MISLFDLVIKDLYQKYFIEPETEPNTRQHKTHQKDRLMMSLKGLHSDDKGCVKDLGPTHIGKLVLI